MIPPSTDPMTIPRGIAPFQMPIMSSRFFSGKKAEMRLYPPGTYPDSPMPTATRAVKSCLKFMAKAQEPVARLQRKTRIPMLLVLRQRSMRMDNGKVKRTIDQ